MFKINFNNFLRNQYYLSNCNALLFKLVFLAYSLHIVSWVISVNDISRIYDDAYMFSRYSKQLLSTLAISWDMGGPPVYGLTSPLYLIITTPINYFFYNNPAFSTFLSSFVSGLFFLLLLFGLFHQVFKSYNPKDSNKHYLICLIIMISTLVSFSVRWLNLSSLFSLSSEYDAFAFEAPLIKIGIFYITKFWHFHFLSGMDTAFAMFYMTLYLVILTRFAFSRTRSNTILITFLSAFAYLVRPEFAVLLITPAILFFKKDPQSKKLAIQLILINGILFSMMLTMLWLYFGTAVTNSFWIKSSNYYGEDFYFSWKVYSKTLFFKFIDQNIFLIFFIVIGLLSSLAKKAKKISKVEILLLFYIIVLSVYFTFFSAQIMGHASRFYQPLFPLLIYLAYLGLSRLLPVCKDIKIEYYLFSIFLICFFILCFLTLKNVQNIAVNLHIISPAKYFNVEFAHKRFYPGVWYKLNRIVDLPDDLVIATSEVGLPGAWSPKKKVIDLAGLNVRDLNKSFFVADSFFYRYQPDLIYFHHPVYEKIREGIIRSDYFKENYIFLGENQINTLTGVGVYQKSKYYNQIMELLSSPDVS